MSQNHVIELPNTPKRPIVCDYSGGRFRLTTEGLTFIGIDKDGNPLSPQWICAPLYVVAKTRDAQSGEWGRLLEWQDDDGITHQWAMRYSQKESIEVQTKPVGNSSQKRNASIPSFKYNPVPNIKDLL